MIRTTYNSNLYDCCLGAESSTTAALVPRAVCSSLRSPVRQ